MTVVTQVEADMIREVSLGSAGGADRLLVLREGNAGDISPCHLGQIKGQAAPAGANIQHAQSGTIELQLGSDMALLGSLSLFQCVVRFGKIGTGILPVRIQEQTIEPVREIVVVRDI